MKFSALAAACVGAMVAAPTLALDSIVIKGSKFFNEKTGEQFFFKGVAYQPRSGVSGDLDPLADPIGCKRDIAVFKELGLNSIRVYEVDYSKDHDECMKMLEDAGIYLVLDMPSPKYAINRVAPYWDEEIMGEWKKKVDAFSKYSNLLAWIAGNEVTNDKDTTPASAFVKAAIRDMKAYIKSKGHSTPVGYADNDDMNIRMNLIDYFNCGDEKSRADFYGINIYRWCGDKTTFKTSGYEDVTKNMTDYSIPSLLTEFGCNKVRPRTFPELKSLYGPDMNTIFSGGIMYEYSEEDNDYGIVSVSYGDAKLTKTGDYENLKKALAAAKPKGVKMSDYKPATKESTCPTLGPNWHIKSDVLPPTPSTARCSCMMDSLSCTLASTTLTKDEGTSLGDALGYICGQTSCDGVSHNTTKGFYGDYSACSSAHRSAWVLNENFSKSKKCDVDGVKTTTVKSPKQKDQGSCLKQKDDLNNDGAVSSGSGSNSKSPSSSSSSSSSGKSSANENAASAVVSVQLFSSAMAVAALFALF